MVWIGVYCIALDHEWSRKLAYDDFIAVAEDLVRRGVTSPSRLGR